MIISIWVLFFFSANLLHAQVQFGVRAGVPITSTFSTTQYAVSNGNGSYIEDGYTTSTKRLLIGPTVGVKLPRGFSLHLDALYQRVSYDQTFYGISKAVSTSKYFSHETANRWQFPLLLRHELNLRFIRPFIEGGPSLSYIVNGHDRLGVFNNVFGKSSQGIIESDHLMELRKKAVLGATAGLGVDLHIGALHIQPELRYTRWASKQFSAVSQYAFSDLANNVNSLAPSDPPGIASKRDEAQFLLGFTF